MIRIHKKISFHYDENLTVKIALESKTRTLDILVFAQHFELQNSETNIKDLNFYCLRLDDFEQMMMNKPGRMIGDF